jgi:Cdc6-like AAA superfamily ATPase
MEQLVLNGLKNTAKDVNGKQNVNQWLDMSKPLREAVGTGLKAVPQAAVPWAGICCALEVGSDLKEKTHKFTNFIQILSSPLTEPKKNRDGMEYVIKRMDWYWRLSPWLLQDSHSSNPSQPLRDQLEKQVTSLYQKLLLFQMKSVILYHRSRFVVFMRDLPKVDDWVSHVKEIKDFETALGVDSTQYNTLEMRTNLQEISVTTKEHAQWQRQERLDEKDNECLRELRITTPQKDKKTIVSSKGGLFYESYRWITENNEYQQWLKEDDNNLLWIKGDPGKGKTMLLAGIIEELEKSTPQSVFYFFCQATEPRLRTATSVLRGLIWFLATTRPRLVSYVRQEYEREGKGVFSDSNAWQTLTGILTTILDDEDSENFTFVVDALDECTADRDQLVRLISRVSSSYKAKWVISSRNWPEIERRLDGVQNKVRLQLELNHAAISDAVTCFVLRKVDELDGENNYDESTREEVQKYLLANADDTFLWVSLVCEELGKPDVMSHHTLDILKSFPAGLGKLYERMVETLNQSRDRDLCKATLGVVGVAYRPLSLAELGASDSRLNGLAGNTGALSNIVRCCGSFLAIRDGTIYTVHQSVKDFLRTSREVMASGVAQQHYNVFLSSVQMMQKGLHRDLYRLNDPGVLIDEIKVPESHPLLSLGYACVHWADHFHDGYLQEPRSERVSAFALLGTFFREKYLYWLEAMILLRCASEAVTAVRKLQNDIVSDTKLSLFR